MQSTPASVLVRGCPPLREFQRRHLADYNVRATNYWFGVVLLGALALAGAVASLARLDAEELGEVLLGTIAAALAGWFPIRKQGAKDGIAAGEVFVFLLLIAHGAGAATLAGAAEAACISWRLSSRWSSRLGGAAMAALTMSLCGLLFEFSLGASRNIAGHGSVQLVSLTLVACFGFVVNTMLVSTVGKLKRGEAITLAPVVQDFASLGLAYAASASIAGLVYVGFLQLGIGIAFALAPIVGIFLATHHFYYRRQEADAAARRASEEAAQRETQQAIAHLHEIQASERRFQCTFTDAAIGMALLTLDGGVVVQCNRSLAALLGRPPEEIVGHALAEFVDPGDVGALLRELATFADRGAQAPDREFVWQRADGETRIGSIHCGAFAEPIDDVRYLIVQLQDVTARRKMETRLRFIAYNDELTALPNRTRFLETLAEEVAMAGADRGRRFAVLFLDLDRFKVVNDSLGHAAGDVFLRHIAARLSGAVRTGDLVARFGGDEFAVLLRDIKDDAEALILAKRLQDALSHPFSVQGTPVSSGASIGITSNGAVARSPDEILRDVDIAMYRAKAGGASRIVFFDPVRHANAAERLHMENDLRRAIETGGLSLVYQPIYRMPDGMFGGVEALVRWHHPERGPLSPAAFIPLAEESGLIAGLTNWVLREACRQLRAWQRLAPSTQAMTMHVNISGWDLQRKEFLPHLQRVLQETGLRPACLTLELTESTLMDRFEDALACLRQIERIGVRLSIDDFGTGYSSLSYLSQMPFDSIKIDRSFVDGLLQGTRDTEIVRTIVTLGKALGKQVVAEGIESPVQLRALELLGCTYVQGFHLSRPLSADRVQAMLLRGETCDALQGKLCPA